MPVAIDMPMPDDCLHWQGERWPGRAKEHHCPCLTFVGLPERPAGFYCKAGHIGEGKNPYRLVRHPSSRPWWCPLAEPGGA